MGPISRITGAGFGVKVPRRLYDFARGDRRAVLASQAATGGLHAGELSYGLQHGVICSEWIANERASDVVRKGRRCAGRVFVSFLANPSGPDTGCVAQLRTPRFEIGPLGAFSG